MKYITSLLLLITCLAAQAANPSFSNFNANQFSQNGSTYVNIKDSALLSNDVHYGTPVIHGELDVRSLNSEGMDGITLLDSLIGGPTVGFIGYHQGNGFGLTNIPIGALWTNLGTVPVTQNQIIISKNGSMINTNANENIIVLSDVTTLNATTGRHGFVPKLPNDASLFFNGAGGYSTPGVNITPTTLTQTNFILNTIYTNGAQTILAKAVAQLTTAAVNGDASVDLYGDQSGGSSFSLLGRFGIGTTVAVTLAMNYTNHVIGILQPNATYFFTNSSTGAGNSGTLIAGTGQTVTISSGTNGATGAAGANGINGTNGSNGTNGLNGASVPDMLVYQTNWTETIKTVNMDATNNSTATLNGFGDSFGFGADPAGGAFTRRFFDGTALAGIWAEMRTTNVANKLSVVGNGQNLTIAPYSNSVISYQCYTVLRNTNNVRFWSGFTSTTASDVWTKNTPVTNTIAFRYSSSAVDTNWIAYVSNATNTTVLDTGVAVVPDSVYLLQFTKTGTNVVFTVNRTNSVTATTNVPNQYVRDADAMLVATGIETLDGNFKTNEMRYVGYRTDWISK